MSIDGTVSKWVDGRGFGFIEYEDDKSRETKSIFVHARELRYDRRVLEKGEKVSFDIADDKKRPGQQMAIEVKGEYRDDPPKKER